MNAKAISEKKNNGGCLVFVGLVFSAAGLFFFWFVFLWPFIQSIGSGNWPQADCKILKSEIEIHSDGDGTSYKPIVEYEYIVDGIQYSGDSPTFEDVAASRKWAKSIVNKYEVGANSKCYYNPNDPGTSVLDRDFLWSFYAMALFPLLFVGLGVALFGSGYFGWGLGSSKSPKTVSGHVRSRSSSSSFLSGSTGQSTNTDEIHEADLLDQEWSGPKRLERSQSRWIGLVAILIFAALWNSFVGFFIYSAITDNVDWFGLVFMIPFVIVGLLLMAGVAYALLSIFSPVVEVALSTGAIGPGESVDVAWEVKGNAHKFKTLNIEVRGRQTAIYRQGTDTYTEEEVFELIPILQTSQTEEMEFGSATVTIPPGTMHTFDASNNKIRWEIQVRGDIPWRPDVNESFEFRVRPV